jgi:ABC-type transport system substrate-binding protein
LKAPFAATFLMGLASESGTIVPKAIVEKLPDQKFTTELPAQCGPYTMVEWTPKQRIVLKSNPDWKGSKPDFPEVHFINVEDTSAADHVAGIEDLDVGFHADLEDVALLGQNLLWPDAEHADRGEERRALEQVTAVHHGRLPEAVLFVGK